MSARVPVPRQRRLRRFFCTFLPFLVRRQGGAGRRPVRAVGEPQPARDGGRQGVQAAGAGARDPRRRAQPVGAGVGEGRGRRERVEAVVHRHAERRDEAARERAGRAE